MAQHRRTGRTATKSARSGARVSKAGKSSGGLFKTGNPSASSGAKTAKSAAKKGASTGKKVVKGLAEGGALGAIGGAIGGKAGKTISKIARNTPIGLAVGGIKSLISGGSRKMGLSGEAKVKVKAIKKSATAARASGNRSKAKGLRAQAKATAIRERDKKRAARGGKTAIANVARVEAGNVKSAARKASRPEGATAPGVAGRTARKAPKKKSSGGRGSRRGR